MSKQSERKKDAARPASYPTPASYSTTSDEKITLPHGPPLALAATPSSAAGPQMQPPRIKTVRRFPVSRVSVVIVLCILLPLVVLVGAHLSLLYSGSVDETPEVPEHVESALRASANFLASTSKFFQGPPTPEPTVSSCTLMLPGIPSCTIHTC